MERKQERVDPDRKELDDFIQAYEAAQACGEPIELTAFLPKPDHPLYRSVLRELVRVDLEYGWERGQPKRLPEYERTFPELFQDLETLHEVAFEEYRLRRQAGENPSPLEYQQRYGITTANWPEPDFISEAVRSGAGVSEQTPVQRAEPKPEASHDFLLAEAALAYQETCARQADGAEVALSWENFFGSIEHAEVFEELHREDPQAAKQLAQAVTRMPDVGSRFQSFHLRAELGRGAFCRAFLAQQGELANRLVVLKIGPHLTGESRMLAQLQHTHIVPIYSFHRAGPFHAVCMPYFGATTLAEVLADLRAAGTLPTSGKDLVTILDARQKAREELVAADNAPASLRRDTLGMLERLTYVEAILWIAARLAEGLAHAHERGILHRDLKPANILLTDDGQPMLSDFNLSEDMKLRTSPSAARIGGTLGYMAPEHLDAFQAGTRPVDARSDLYAFGIILFELLTGRCPFTLPRGPLKQVLATMIADRLQPPPAVRRWNRAVSPAVESIVRHCLEPEPSRRYHSAQQLRDDLQRQLDHLPLKFASEPSLWERAGKWRHRHPRLASSTTVGVLAALILCGLVTLLAVRSRRLTRLEAVTSLHQLHEDLKTAHFLLSADEAERSQWEEGLALGHRILQRYRISEASPWQESAVVHALSMDEKQRLHDDLGELLLVMAGATARQAKRSREPAKRQEWLLEAQRLNRLAEECYSPLTSPRALWRQRAELARLAGHTEEAQRLLQTAETIPLRNVRDRYLLIADEFQPGARRQTVAFLREACRREPDNFTWWLLLGNCQAALAQPAQAAASYDRAIALWPKAHWVYFNRGVLYLEQLKDYRQACEDFDQFLALRPDVPAAYYNRALAKYFLRDWPGALADLNYLLKADKPSLRAYFLRAKVRDKMGDPAGAQQDRSEGLRREPADDKDWIARGVVRLAREPQAALEDFQKAREVNPHSRLALQNLAHVLGEKLGRTQEAIQALDELIELDPDYVHARASRGVYLARLGQRDAAHRDAKESLLQSSQPATLYQVAGIYALTARQNPDDRWESFRLLSSALRKGYGFDLLAQDRDLDPIRDYPEFRRLVDAAQTLRVVGPQRSTHPKKTVRSDRN